MFGTFPQLSIFVYFPQLKLQICRFCKLGLVLRKMQFNQYDVFYSQEKYRNEKW